MNTGSGIQGRGRPDQPANGQKLENWTIFKFPVEKIIRLQNSSRYNNPL